MIAVVYGTTGELIKLAPVLIALQQRGAPVITLCTGQQVQQIPQLLEDFGLPQPTLWLGRGHHDHDLERPGEIPPWVATVAKRFTRSRSTLAGHMRADASRRPLVLVHGDTFTTVLGALIGRALRVPVAHLEAGLRSGDWRNPFPEELDRLVTSRLAQIHLAPGAWAAQNLRAAGVSGEIVDCGANTIGDALELVPPGRVELELPDEPFGLVSIHRFELLGKPVALRAILELLRDASRETPLLFVDHPVTAAAIAAQDLGHVFGDRLRRIPRQRYFRFISLLKASAFLVTDSGGSQEECAYLGHPCLVHRAATERQDGLGANVVLSHLQLPVSAEFLADPSSYAAPPAHPEVRPTSAVLDHLAADGFL